MARVLFALVVLNLISDTKNVLGEAVAYFPPDSRAANQYHYTYPQLQPYNRNAIPQGYVLTNDHGTPQDFMDPQENIQPIFHVNPGNVPQLVPDIPTDGLNFTNEFSRFFEDNFRAVKSDYGYPTHSQPPSYPQAPSYSYNTPAPSYSPPAAAPAAPSYAPPAPAQTPQPKFPILKPDLTSLIKPVTTKVAGKVSGLIGLVLSLFSGAGDNLEFHGFKDIIINGIIKPLLIAKGGIKSLISKLAIPVIALLLINVEVLITVWWLWEECPETKPVYEYTKPTYSHTAPNYNSYR